MEMLLMGLCISVFGFGVAALAFGAATRSESSAPQLEAQPEIRPAVAARAAAPARFFSDRVVPAVPFHSQVPIEVLLHQIENHVRLEEAAAQSFVDFPSLDLLHCKTTSSLVN